MKKEILFPGFVIAACLLVYSTTLQNGFMIDDFPTLLEFEKVRSLSYLKDIFRPDAMPGSMHYRPLFAASNILLYAFFRDQPVGYH